MEFESSAGWESARRAAERAHRALLTAAQRLERSLHMVTARGKWYDHVRQQLELLNHRFAEHCVASEGPGGIIREMEVRLGHPGEVTAIQTSHHQITELIASLLDELGNDGSVGEPYSRFRRKALQLIGALREHDLRETDLIYETHWRVNGIGD